MATAVSFADGLVDRRTRMRTLEAAVVAHRLLAPEAIDPFRQVPLSADATTLVDLIADDPACSRSALVSYARARLRLAWAAGAVSTESCRAVIRLALTVSRTSVGDLASVGSFSHVVRLLASIRHDESEAPAPIAQHRATTQPEPLQTKRTIDARPESPARVLTSTSSR